MKPKLRWKKQPSKTGLRTVGQGPCGYNYYDGDKLYATVYPKGGDWSSPLLGWYWVAGWDSDVPYKNTCYEWVTTPKEAKKQAAEYVAQFFINTESKND